MVTLATLKIIWRSGFNIFRVLVIAIVTIVVTIICCLVASAALMVERVDERASARTFTPAFPEQSADLSRDVIYDSVDGEPLFVYYWRIEKPNVSIPGISTTAAIEQWFVSPELQRKMSVDPLLYNRFPEALLIGDEGIGAADELVAYQLVGPEVKLRERLLAIPNTEWIGLNASIDNLTVVLVGTGILLTIGAGLLAAALGTVTTNLEQRLSILNALGATHLMLWMVAAACVALIVFPVSIAASGFWYVLAPQLRSVPIVGQRVLAGDLAIPIWLCGLIVALVTALASTLGARRVPQQSSSRPATRIPKAPSGWRAVPLLGALALIVYSTTQTGAEAVHGLLIGLIAASLCVIIALPILIYWVGNAIAANKSTLQLLLGRRLSWSAATSVRPLMILAALAVVLPVGTSYIAVARSDDSTPVNNPTTAIQFNGAIDPVSQITLEAQGKGVFADVYITESSGNEAPRFTLVSSCQSLNNYVVLNNCGAAGIRIHPSTATIFPGIDSAATTPPRDANLGFRLFITNNAKQAEAVLRSYVVNSKRTDLAVISSEDRDPKEPRSVAWILAGLQVSAFGTFAALLLWVITNASVTAHTRVRLNNLGAQMPMIRRLAASESALTIIIIGLASTAIGTIGAVAYALVDGSIAPNYWPSLVLATAVLLTAATAGVASAIEVAAHQTRVAKQSSD